MHTHTHTHIHTHTHTHPKLDKKEPILRSPLKEILQPSILFRKLIGNVTNINCLKARRYTHLFIGERYTASNGEIRKRGRRERTGREVGQTCLNGTMMPEKEQGI